MFCIKKKENEEREDDHAITAVLEAAIEAMLSVTV